MLQSTEEKGLLTDYWNHSHYPRTEVKYRPASLRVTCVQKIEFRSRCWFVYTQTQIYIYMRMCVCVFALVISIVTFTFKLAGCSISVLK